MCTVTIVPGFPIQEIHRGADAPVKRFVGFRLICNRDELRSRPAALGPERRSFGERMAIMPVDAVSNGTWIGVNDAGLAMCLLNVYRPAIGGLAADPAVAMRSRGEIITSLLSMSTLDEALGAAAELGPTEYPPFRLVLLAGHQVGEVLSNAHGIQVLPPQQADRPLMFTSSGLGDELVDPPRRAVFEELFSKHGDWFQLQDEFHGHSWPDRRHLSVLMSRPEARTVSCTRVTICPDAIEMTYLPIDEEGRTQPVAMRLARNKGTVCC